MPIDDVVIVDLDENQLESPYLSMDLEGFPASLVRLVCDLHICVCVRARIIAYVLCVYTVCIIQNSRIKSEYTQKIQPLFSLLNYHFIN